MKETKTTRNKRRKLRGVVLSSKMQKTAVIGVERKIFHPKYRKLIRKTKKYYAHHEMPLNSGDEVMLTETRPLSKLKNWLVTEVCN